MVPVEKANAYDLRQHLHGKVVDGAAADPFKSCWLSFLGLASAPSLDIATLSLYQRCAIAGLRLLDGSVSAQDLSRLLGQAAKIDSTPRPWVSDVFGVSAVKWLVEQQGDVKIERQFKRWCEGFLPLQISSSKFDDYEHDVASYISDPGTVQFASACVPLFLHYCGKLRIEDHRTRLHLINRFMSEFRQQAKADVSVALLGLMIHVFDKINQDIVLVPPNGWTLADLVTFLEKIPVGLKKWTWEDNARTKGGSPVKWPVKNEYHVQNLLYVLLAPIFNDISDEVYLEPVGQKTPRVDLYLPSMHTIIEVKYRKDTKTSFQKLIGEIAEDASLYRSDPKFKDAKIVAFLWDHTRATQEHAKFKEGVLKISGMDACVAISAPSSMEILPKESEVR